VARKVSHKFASFCSFRDKVVDFHWNASDPWTLVSVSDDCDTTGGGGTLQVIISFRGSVLLGDCASVWIIWQNQLCS